MAENEVLVRMLAIDVLTEAGFVVLEAEHAAQALTHWEAQGADIHVLFTDINMPGDMNGLDLAHRAREHWPWIATPGQRLQPTTHEQSPTAEVALVESPAQPSKPNNERTEAQRARKRRRTEAQRARKQRAPATDGCGA